MMDVFKMIELLKCNPDGIPLTHFKLEYKPIDLADHLIVFEKVGLISVDWSKQKIFAINKDISNEAYKIKVQLTKKRVKTPEYMKDKKIEINKPFIPNNTGRTKS